MEATMLDLRAGQSICVPSASRVRTGLGTDLAQQLEYVGKLDFVPAVLRTRSRTRQR